MKLRTLILAFDLLTSTVAETCGVSRCYVSRLQNDDSFCGSSTFWSNLERNLHIVIQNRRGNIFEVEAVPLEKVESLTKLTSTLKPAA